MQLIKKKKIVDLSVLVILCYIVQLELKFENCLVILVDGYEALLKMAYN